MESTTPGLILQCQRKLCASEEKNNFWTGNVLKLMMLLRRVTGAKQRNIIIPPQYRIVRRGSSCLLIVLGLTADIHTPGKSYVKSVGENEK